MPMQRGRREVLACGAGHVRYKGREGAVLQQGIMGLPIMALLWYASADSHWRSAPQSSADWWGFDPYKVNKINYKKLLTTT
jgi:hypothetical protein